MSDITEKNHPMNEVELAQTLMDEFADATGISGTVPSCRYLWTDAFAVCNFLGLFRQTGDQNYLNIAAELVHQVHHILGRHRPDDFRRGWISGLSEIEGEQHPTRGGLRIGKRLPERQSDRDWDPRLEWDRDGQYFHYLTKWMHALNCLGRVTGDPRYLQWAIELAIAAHQGFTCRTSFERPRRMAWKMSIDLSRPLVTSMGQHDPLDGLVACLELRHAAESSGQPVSRELHAAIEDLHEMCGRTAWATDDPLGIGGLLDDLVRLVTSAADDDSQDRDLLQRIGLDLEVSLEALDGDSLFCRPVEQRLAFRELGLSIGMRGLEYMNSDRAQASGLAGVVNRLMRYRPASEQIIACWSESRNRSSPSWDEHRDINTVMLATSLMPDGYFQFSRDRWRSPQHVSPGD